MSEHTKRVERFQRPFERQGVAATVGRARAADQAVGEISFARAIIFERCANDVALRDLEPAGLEVDDLTVLR